MNRFIAADRGDQLIGQFALTYGTINRIWCNRCEKHQNLSDLSDATVAQHQASHVCGSRTSPWTSRGDS